MIILSRSNCSQRVGGRKLKPSAISHGRGGVDHFIYGLPVDDCNGSNPGRTKYLPDHSTVTGVVEREVKAVKDVAEESSKDCAPGVRGAWLLTLGQAGQKREDHL